MTQPNCKQRVAKEWQYVKKDLKKFFDKSDYEGLANYGLSIDLVEAKTFKNQKRQYIRYQFSWGGPSDELRIYKNGDIEYWFLDWFDGACIDVTDDDTAKQASNYCQEFISFN